MSSRENNLRSMERKISFGWVPGGLAGVCIRIRATFHGCSHSTSGDWAHAEPTLCLWGRKCLRIQAAPAFSPRLLSQAFPKCQKMFSHVECTCCIFSLRILCMETVPVTLPWKQGRETWQQKYPLKETWRSVTGSSPLAQELAHLLWSKAR